MRPPLLRQGQFYFWLVVTILMWLALILGAAYIAPLFAAEIHWQQPDGEAPVVAWRVKRFQSPTPVATLLRTAIAEETVTPGYYPTPGPGTPQPTLRQYTADVPVQPGWLVYFQAEDSRGLLSADSNLKVIPTLSPTPAPTRTATTIPTATARRPEAPLVLP